MKEPATDLVEEKNEVSNVFLIFGLCVVFTIIASAVYFLEVFSYPSRHFQWLLLRATYFLFLLATMIFVYRIVFYRRVVNFARTMGFHIITRIFEQPKIEGTYKGNHWQFHYRSKEGGKDPAFLRTYVKLIYHVPKEFDQKALDRQRHTKASGQKIISVKHVIRKDKNYLLMKVENYIFDKETLHKLMDHLLEISKESLRKELKRS